MDFQGKLVNCLCYCLQFVTLLRDSEVNHLKEQLIKEYSLTSVSLTKQSASGDSDCIDGL